MAQLAFDALSVSDVNVNRVRQVELSFGGGSFPLLRHGRVLLAEGVLTKICHKQPKPRHFFLFNDLLVYGSPSGLRSSRCLSKQRIFELDCLVTRVVEAKPTDFQVISPKKSFRVQANTPQEAGKWIDCIRRSAARSSWISAAAAVATSASQQEASPVWIPDGRQPDCMACGQRFTFVNRRHHCRKCGSLVCGTCSANRWLLPAQGRKPQRVCQTCHHLLSSRGSGYSRHRQAPSSSESGSDVFALDEASPALPPTVPSRFLSLQQSPLLPRRPRQPKQNSSLPVDSGTGKSSSDYQDVSSFDLSTD